MSFTGSRRLLSLVGRRRSLSPFAASAMLIAALLVPVLLALSGPALAVSDLEEANTEAKVSAYLSHLALAAGGEGTLLIVLDVPPDFHVQINEFLEVTVAEDAPVILGKLNVKPNTAWHGEGVLKNKAALSVPFAVAPGVPSGVATITFVVGYQGCSEAPTYACFPPNWIETTLSLDILAAGAAAVPAHAEIFAQYGLATTTAPAAPQESRNASLSLEDRLKGALARGSFLAFLLVFVGGILASFTPCVYPMIPITISYVGGRARSRMHGFALSLLFVLGIALTYAALGVAAAATGAVFGSMMQSTAAIIVVAAIFAAMGASMLGAFDLVLPSGLTTGMQTASAGATHSGTGILGAVLMGATTGLVASPCVGPVLVVLLAFVAETGNLFHGFWLLFTFACGLGLLFLLLGTFASAISALPGAGSWMDTVKHVFGVILLGMAIYYLRTILPPAVTRFLASVLLVAVGVFTGAFHPMTAASTKGQMMRKTIGILAFLAGAVVFLAWLFTLVGLPLAPAGVGPTAAPGLAAGHLEPAWRVNDEPALAEAAIAGRPAILDFWATWCAACIELDEKTWVDPRIYAEVQRFTTVKMDLTRNDDFATEVRRRHQVVGMPTVILFDSQGNEATRFSGFKGPDEVLALLQSVR